MANMKTEKVIRSELDWQKKIATNLQMKLALGVVLHDEVAYHNGWIDAISWVLRTEK
jgi:hypothetical protein